MSEDKINVKSTLISIWCGMDHVSWSLGLFSTTTFWRHAQHKIGDESTMNILIIDELLYLIVCEDLE